LLDVILEWACGGGDAFAGRKTHLLISRGRSGAARARVIPAGQPFVVMLWSGAQERARFAPRSASLEVDGPFTGRFIVIDNRDHRFRHLNAHSAIKGYLCATASTIAQIAANRTAWFSFTGSGAGHLPAGDAIVPAAGHRQPD